MSPQDMAKGSVTDRQAHRGRWVPMLLAAVLVFLCGFFALLVYVTGVGAQGFMPAQISASYYSPKDLVGNLGGMPVRIDRRIVNLVEYDGDPGWGEKRQGPPPERTHTSRIASFGFQVRFPDMRSLDEPDVRADYDRYHPTTPTTEYGLKEKNPWLMGDVASGSRYPGHGFLDRRFWGNDGIPVGKGYKREPSPIQGLELYVLGGIDPSSGIPWRYESSWGDVYVHRNLEGKVTTYIACSYRRNAAPTICSQTWSMEDNDLGIKVTLTYRHGLVLQWQDIQTKVSGFVSSWLDHVALKASAQIAH